MMWAIFVKMYKLMVNLIIMITLTDIVEKLELAAGIKNEVTILHI